MYHFKVLVHTIELIEETEELNALILILRLVKDTNNINILSADQITFVAVQLTHWRNTSGKSAPFTAVIKRFNSFCKEAEKLKI